MKKISFTMIIILLVSVIVFGTLLGCKESDALLEEEVMLGPNAIKVMSYNVKVADIMQEIVQSEISYSKRYERMKQIIEDEMPDLIGLQEATYLHMQDFMRDFGSEYEAITYYRNGGYDNYLDTIELKGSGVFDESGPILYKKDKFELVEYGCNWLSDTPDIVGSSTWGADHVRICTYVKLRIKETGVEFMYHNTHLNWGLAQDKATVLLSQILPVDIPYFITGDFNLRPDSTNYTRWSAFMTDTRTSPENMADTPTSNGFDAPGNDSIIDYCFVDKDNFKLISHKVLNDDIARFGEGKFASDHFAIVIVFEIVPAV